MECSKCGAINVRLFDVITGEGIIKLCQYCLSEEDAPVIKKPTSSQFQAVNKTPSIYERLSKSAGLDAKEHKKNIFGSSQQEQMKQQEATLRGLVDRKYDGKIKEIPRKREDLIENFHWIIMRARRNKKMTVTQFAKEIGESEAVVKMAEQGVLPDGDYNIVKKIEAVLSINILKREFAQKAEHKKRLGFDDFSTKTLTISDLHEMKKDEIEAKPEQEPYWKRLMNALTRKKAPVQASAEEEKPVQQNEVDDEIETGNLREIPIEFNNTTLEITGSLEEAEQEDRIKKAPEDLTDKDIDDLIFGKKK